MTRIKLTLQYKGTKYSGWQVQPNGTTIQEILQKTLFRIVQKKVHVVGSGRTDSGVHALGQVCHFDLPVSRRANSLHKIIFGLNSLLPEDISIIDGQIVNENFHSLKSAKRKIYDYTLLNSPLRFPFLHDYVWRHPYPLDIKKMRRAAKLLVGEHDFKAFCAADSTVKTTVRRVYRLSVTTSLINGRPHRVAPTKSLFFPVGAALRGCPPRLIKITIIGNGFLKHMVRNIVGTLAGVGRGKMTWTEFKKVFKGKDRRKAGITAPAKGLVLREVVY